MNKDAIQQIVCRHINTHGFTGSPVQNKALRCISQCRTGVLGGTKIVCNDCGAERFLYKSCGNRHCPQCSSLNQLLWKEARSSEYVMTTYYHAVFTVPSELNPVFLNHQKECYNLLFKTVSSTLLTLAADPNHLNARIGFICVLHTWGSNLAYHPHIHVMLIGCGLNRFNKIVKRNDNFLFPVKVMSSLFRGKFLDGLKKLQFPEYIPYTKLYGRDWVVFIKPSLPDNSNVVEYLSRYTHKTAISSSRIISHDDKSVTFRYKDYRDNAKIKEMTLDSEEFVRRFLLHVLPPGFIKVRFYGLLANRNKNDALAILRKLLNQKAPVNRLKNKCVKDILTVLFGDRFCKCTKCGSKNLSSIPTIPRPGPA